MTQAISRTYSLENYRALEETAVERHEYRKGAIVATAGGTIEHSTLVQPLRRRIAGNMYALLKNALRRTRFKPYNSNLRIWIPQYQRGVYPDVMAIEGAAEFNDDRRDKVVNPTLIVEVLSRSIEAYDRGDKFKFYRSLPTFCECVLIDQYQPWVECYGWIDEDDWLRRSHEGLEAAIELKIIETPIELADIYEDIVWKAPRDTI